MIKKIIVGLSLVVVLAVALVFTPPFAHIRNYIRWGQHSIFDYRTHPSRVVKAAENPQPWIVDSTYNKRQMSASYLAQIDSNNTHAFLVIQNGKIVYEKYFDNYTIKTLSGSFSAAKSIISLLIGIGIEEGKIKSVEQPVADFVPHFKEGDLAKIRIKDLLTMSSGLTYSEKDKSYFSLNAKAYYGDDEEYMVNEMQVKEPAGIHWEYRSGDTQVLGLIVEKAFGRTISDLVSEKLFKPMGAETDALWLLDGDKKHEKSFCCFNAIARDYARFGQLILNNGRWGDKQLVSEKYVKEATSPDIFLKDPTEGNKPVDYYGYQYWIVNHNGRHDVSMNGLFGQYVYILKDKNAIVVRLGESKVTKPVHHYQTENFTYIDAALSVLN